MYIFYVFVLNCYGLSFLENMECMILEGKNKIICKKSLMNGLYMYYYLMGLC